MKPMRQIVPRPEIGLYRSLTIALLRRYFRMSIEIGRLPSLVGREFFRARTRSYRVTSFEDVVIFCYDVERCLTQLDLTSQQVIGRVILEEHSYPEAARLLHCVERTIHRNLIEALDLVAELFLQTGMLRELGRIRPPRAAKSCQAGENDDFAASA